MAAPALSPVGTVTCLPFTVTARRLGDQDQHLTGRSEGSRTANFQKPILWRCSRDEVLKVDVTRVQRRIGPSQCEYPSESFLRRRCITKEAIDPKGHFRLAELVGACEGLPEGHGFGVCKALEGKTHYSCVGAIEQVGRSLVDKKPVLLGDCEAPHGYGVLYDCAFDLTRAVSDRHCGGLSALSGRHLECAGRG